MHRDVWLGAALGALLSIPIGIGTGLLIAPIQRWYQSWGKTREEARHARIEREYAQALSFVRYPHMFTRFAFRTVVSMVMAITFWLAGSFLGVLMAEIKILEVVTKQAFPMPRIEHIFIQASLFLSGVMVAVGLARLTQEFQKFRDTGARVARFRTYVESVPDDIRRLSVEEYVWKKSLD